MNNFNCSCCRNFVWGGFYYCCSCYIFELVYIVYRRLYCCQFVYVYTFFRLFYSDTHTHTLSPLFPNGKQYTWSLYMLQFRFMCRPHALSPFLTHSLFDCIDMCISLIHYHYFTRSLFPSLYPPYTRTYTSIITHVSLKIQCKLPFDHNSMLKNTDIYHVYIARTHNHSN